MAAIYVPAQVRTVVMTTTLYPVEADESVVFGIKVAAASMDLLAVSGPSTVVIGMLGGTLIQERWFIEDGPYDSGPSTIELGMLGGTLIQERWFITDGPYDSGPSTIALGMLGGTLINKLVIVDSPDELLQLNARISSCSMDLI